MSSLAAKASSSEDELDDEQEYEGDLQPLLDELAALREALGEDYQEVAGHGTGNGMLNTLDNDDDNEILPLPTPSNKFDALKIALECNQQLQARLQRFIKSIERGQDSVEIIREKVRQIARQRQANAPHEKHEKGFRRWSGRVSGVS
jgi:hypothetical protein